jgi:hypothetical protein
LEGFFSNLHSGWQLVAPSTQQAKLAAQTSFTMLTISIETSCHRIIAFLNDEAMETRKSLKDYIGRSVLGRMIIIIEYDREGKHHIYGLDYAKMLEESDRLREQFLQTESLDDIKILIDNLEKANKKADGVNILALLKL